MPIRVKRVRIPCKCGCGQLAKIGRKYVAGHYDHGAAQRGTKHSLERRQKQSIGTKKAHAEGRFVESARRRRKNPSSPYPRRCICGCGQLVTTRQAKYAPGCFNGPDPENLAKARAARDWSKLGPRFSEAMSQQMAVWKATGQLDAIRRKAGIARGMLDHLSAKTWVIRDPYGNVHEFSNLAEWARQNAHRFQDDRPNSSQPFWKRIANGIGGILKTQSRYGSYKGWMALSNAEIEDADLP